MVRPTAKHGQPIATLKFGERCTEATGGIGNVTGVRAQDVRSCPLFRSRTLLPNFLSSGTSAVVPQLEIFLKINVAAMTLNSNDFG